MLQVRIYGFSQSPIYEAATSPCPHTVECQTSKARERTVFMTIMLSVASLSALLTLAELVSSRSTPQNVKFSCRERGVKFSPC